MVLNRKNALFAGHDQGAENWVWPASRLDELMPWAWAAERSASRRAA
jgi:transposase